MQIPASLQSYVPLVKGVAIALGILIGGWIVAKWANRLTRRALSHRRVDEALARFLASILQYTVIAAAIITALGAVGIQTTSMVAVFASAGLAIGLALQGSLASFASGVMILFFRPFTLNDKVTIGGQTGVVHDIGLFATTLITGDNETIIVPNNAITSASIINFTKQGTLRGAVDVGVAYGTDVAKALGVIAAAAKRTELILADPAPAVAFGGFGPYSLNFTVFGWAKAADYLGMLHNLRRAVYEDLNTAKIAIPLSQVVVQKAS
jgi:small conductance mechanosensitive channel